MGGKLRRFTVQANRDQQLAGFRVGCSGVTLVEVLLATVVLATGLASILALFPPALEANRASTEETRASILGESIQNLVLEACRNSNSGRISILNRSMSLPGEIWIETDGLRCRVAAVGDKLREFSVDIFRMDRRVAAFSFLAGSK